MNIVFSACHKDYEACERLLTWVHELQENYYGHGAIIVLSSRITKEQQARLMSLLKDCQFSFVSGIKQRDEYEMGWPASPNKMFAMAAEYVEQQHPSPFLWCESDMTPIRPGWLDAIAMEYERGQKPYMGVVFDWVSAASRLPHMTGCGVYPGYVRRYNPRSLAATSIPWDVTDPHSTLRHLHKTNLIYHSPGPDLNAPKGWTFDSLDSLKMIPTEAVLMHSCKDGTLIQRLREQRGIEPETLETPPSNGSGVMDSIRRSIMNFVGLGHTFYHSGNLGDVMYALYAIKAAGGGELVIGPEQHKTALCAVPIDRRQFDMLQPLLDGQSYLTNVRYSATRPAGVYDLNHFRNHWQSRDARMRRHIDTLCKCHFFELGILSRFKEDEPWIECQSETKTSPIVVHRSPRYQAPSTGPGSFPWKRLVDKHADDMMFIGLQTEWEAFTREFKCNVSFYRVKDFLDMAKVIQGAKVFIGNQSFPLAIALALGKPVIVEGCPRSPDCRFKRANYTDQLISPSYEALTKELI